MSEAPLAEWSSDRLRHEVSKLLHNESYLWMTPGEMRTEELPSTDGERRDFIRARREMSAVK